MTSLDLPDQEPASPLDPSDPILTNPTVALAVKSFRNMRSAALTPVARRLRAVMLKRNPYLGPLDQTAVSNPAADWTEVTIACPPLPAKNQGAVLNGGRRLVPPGQLVCDALGADVLVLAGAVLAFLGSGITLLATYGSFSNPETRPVVLGLGPPLVGIGFVFCLLRLFFCKLNRLPCYRCFKKLFGRNSVHPGSRQPRGAQAKVVAPSTGLLLLS